MHSGLVKIKPTIRIRPTSLLPPASSEQQTIITDIKAGLDVLVDAVAGSGKTTTILHIAQQLARRCLVVTYNAQLKFETRQRVESGRLTNVDVHTYHSACSTYFSTGGASYNDCIRSVGDGSASLKAPMRYDILIVDEVQDMNSDFYRVIGRFISSIRQSQMQIQTQMPTLVILGDIYQCIYNFGSSPADPRYLTLSPQLYPDRNFSNRNLLTSYRVTDQVAQFINHMIGSRRIRANKSGEKVQYYSGSPFRSSHAVFKHLMSLLGTKYSPEDVFILAQSVKRLSAEKPIHKLENMLVEEGIPVFRPLSDDCEMRQEEVTGKVVISSFHQSKGRERRVVICYGYDSNYFKYSGKEGAIRSGHIDPTVCPNEWYVATSRAIDILIVVSGEQSPHWMTQRPPPSCTNIISVGHGHGHGRDFIPAEPYYCGRRRDPEVSVTDLCKFKTSGQVFAQIQELYVPLLSYSQAGQTVDISQYVKSIGGGIENVSDITSLAVSYMYEERVTGKARYLHDQIGAGGKIDSIAAWLEYANYAESQSSGYINRIGQITQYDWLSTSQRDMLLLNYETHLGRDPDIVLEKSVQRKYSTRSGQVTVAGRIDAVSSGDLWEFKLTTELKPEHILQLLIYMSITEGRYRNYRLLNIRTGEVISIRWNQVVSDAIMKLLFETHYEISHCTDDEFLKHVYDASVCGGMDDGDGDDGIDTDRPLI